MLPTENQAYSVTPGDTVTKTASTSGTGTSTDTRGSVQYTVGGISSAKVDIKLVDPADVKIDANGQVTFLSSSTAGQADLTAGDGYISVVNGVATSGTPDHAYGIAPNGGSVSFTVNSTDTGSAIPVIFSQDDNNDVLEVASTTTSSTNYAKPTEAFAVGGKVVWTAPAATTGSYSASDSPADGLTVTSVDTAAKTFQAQVGSGAERTFTYGVAGSTYQDVTGALLSESQFAAELSKGDMLNSNYNANGPSTFTYTKDVPAAPTGVTASYDATNKNVKVSWTASPNLDVDNYTVNRYTVASDGTVGTTATVVTTTATGTSYTDSSVTSGSYQYAVVANDTNNGGGSSPESDNTSTVTVPAAADTTAPMVSSLVVSDNNAGGGNGIIDNGDQIALTFPEKVTVASNASITLRDNDGSVGTLTRGGNATMSLNSAGTTLFINVTGAPVPEQAGTTLGLDADQTKETVSNSSGIADVAGNSLAEVNVAATNPAVGATTVTFTANAPVDATTVTTGDFTATGSRTVSSVAVSGKTITVTMSGTVATGDKVTLKADSIKDTDGGNGPAAAVTATTP